MADWDVQGINWKRERWWDLFSSYSSLVGTISKACLSVMTWHWQISSVIRSTFSRLYYVSNKRGKINDVLESDIHHHHNSIYSSFFFCSFARSLAPCACFFSSYILRVSRFFPPQSLFVLKHWSFQSGAHPLASASSTAEWNETDEISQPNPNMYPRPRPGNKGRKWKKIEKIKINPL